MLFKFFVFTTFLIPITAFALGFYTLFTNPKSKVVKMWFLFSVAVGTWGFFHFMHLISNTAEKAVFYGTFLHFGAILIPVFFYHFILEFLYLPKNRTALYVGYFIATLFIVLLFTTNSIVSGASPKAGFPFWTDAGPLYVIFAIYFWTYVAIPIYLLLHEHKTNDGIRRKQTFFILIGLITGFISGGTNFLPMLFGIYPFGSFITFIYPFIIFYGVFLTGRKIRINFK